MLIDSLTKMQPDKMTSLDLADTYVPPDEKFIPKKLSELISNLIQAIAHFIIPETNSLFEQDSATSFETFDELRDLYAGNKNSQVLEGLAARKLRSLVPNEQLYKMIIDASKDHSVRFPIPRNLEL